MKKDLKILIAPDSFKGSLSATKIANFLCSELINSSLYLKVEQLPLADGGEGSLEAIQQCLQLESIKLNAFNPLFKEIETEYLLDKRNSTAYIELAKTSGYHLIEDEPGIMKASTFGTGKLIKHAIENGAEKIILFIGGSATNDGGLGILEALGYTFFNSKGEKVKPLPINMVDIKKVDNSGSILNKKKIEIRIAADVTNPFYGPDGAAYVYAPQKGAKPMDVKLLDAGLQHLAKLIYDNSTIDIQNVAGAGAAGGVGGGLYAFAGAEIVSGAEFIFDLLNIEEKIKATDIIISGEGKIDKQSMNNKLL